MKDFWYKARKEFVIGFDTAKGIFGVKNVSHDEEVKEKVKVLEDIEASIHQLQSSLQLYIPSVSKLITSSHAAFDNITSNLQPSDGDYFLYGNACKDIIQKYSQINEEISKNQDLNNCITPLVEYQQHIKSLKLILEKAKKNKILYTAATKNQEERHKRFAKMEKYQTAFCGGVDILAAKKDAVISGVFNAHQYNILSLVSEVKTRLPKTLTDFTKSPQTAQFPSIESCLEQENSPTV